MYTNANISIQVGVIQRYYAEANTMLKRSPAYKKSKKSMYHHKKRSTETQSGYTHCLSSLQAV